MKERSNQKHYWLRKVAGVTCAENIMVLVAMTCLVAQSEAESVALCYAYEPNVDALSQFDWAVVDSEANFEPSQLECSESNTIWLSYVSVGEVQSHRPYFNEMPRDWLIGANTEWASYIINQTASGWPSFFVNKVIAPLWNREFEGFFLDTLDSYQRVVTTDAERQAQQDGLAQTILALKEQFPDAILILNRGFEIMDRVHQAADMVAFESLFAGWNQAEQKFVQVNQNDRDWLLARVWEIEDLYDLSFLAIDYCHPENLTCIKNTVELITEQEIMPYVTDPMLQTVGVGPNMD